MNGLALSIRFGVENTTEVVKYTVLCNTEQDKTVVFRISAAKL